MGPVRSRPDLKADGDATGSEVLGAFVEDLEEAVIFADSTWRISYVNREAGRLLSEGLPDGVSPVGRDLQAVIAGELRAVLIRHCLQAASEQTAATFEVFLNSRSQWFGGRVAPLPTGFSIQLRDLTESRSSEDGLRASERRFRALVENGWEGVSLVGADGSVLYTSPASLRLMGRRAEEVLGNNLFAHVDPEDIPRLRRVFEALLSRSGGVVTDCCRVCRGDGSWRWLESTGVNRLDDPGIGAIVVNFRDVTEQRAVAEELLEADRRKDAFLAMLAHELRNPMAGLCSASMVLSRLGRDNAQIVKMAGIVARQTRQLAHLVDDLLDVSRITRGQIELQKSAVDICEVARQAVESVRPVIDAQNHRLTVRIEASPCRVMGDAVRLEQILVNLLENAARYTRAGGDIWLEVGHQDESVLMRVRDTGIGIRGEDVSRIFDLFVQAGPAPGLAPGGLGIGLTLVQNLVQLHGGSIRVLSDGPGKGSEFVVRLPMLAVTPAAASEDPDQAAEKRPVHRSVLVVEDSADLAETLAELLTFSGAQVTVAHDGIAALEAATSLRPDLILLDIGLPGMDGYEVARRLRSRPELDGTVMIALTGYGSAADQRRSSEVGFDGHLTKPVEAHELRQVLHVARERR